MHPNPHLNNRTPSPSRWRHGAIPVIGLVGEIGAGKSQGAALLAGRGAVVIDADSVGHDVLEEQAVRDSLVARFGAGIIDGSGARAINRRALGAIVFADAQALRDLEAIVHPRMRRIFEAEIARVVSEGRARAVVLDAAILLEKGWDTLCDLVLFVTAPRDQRLARLAAQRGWTEEMLRAREQAQWPSEEKRRHVNGIIDNSAGLAQLETAVDDAWDWIFSPARSVPPTGMVPAGARGPRPAARGQPSLDPTGAPGRR